MSAALRDGFTVLPALFTAEEIDSLRQAIVDSIDRVARVMLTPFETSLPSTPLDERLGRVAQDDRAYASALLQVVMADAQRDARLTAAIDPDRKVLDALERIVPLSGKRIADVGTGIGHYPMLLARRTGRTYARLRFAADRLLRRRACLAKARAARGSPTKRLTRS